MPPRLTLESFIKQANVVHNNEFTYLNAKYVNYSTPIAVTCKKHGDFFPTPNNHIRRASKCPRCAGTAPKTTAEFISQVNTIHPGKFTFDRTIYTNDSTKLTLTCVKHGDFVATPTNVLQGSGCTRCAKERLSMLHRTTQAEFVQKAAQIHNNKYDYSQTLYVNSHTPITIICPSHGAFHQRPTTHIHGLGGCSKCNSSIGEIKVRTWLQTHNITFIEQHSFVDCIHKQNLRFDFFIPCINTLIEYQGIQHYRPVGDFWKSNDSLEITQQRDAIKRQYATTHNIRLIAIPFTSNVDTFLNKQLLPYLHQSHGDV